MNDFVISGFLASTMKIAIIKLGALGDVVRTTSILHALHKKYPHCQIHWYTSAASRPLLERNTYIHAITVVEGGALPPDISAVDLVISLDEDIQAATLASQIPSEALFGVFRDEKGNVRYTPSSRRWFDISLLNRDPLTGLMTANELKQKNQDTYPDLLAEMLDLPSEFLEPLIVPAPESERWAQAFPKPAIGINTGSGARWVNKQLSIEKTVALIQALNAANAGPLLLMGGPEEQVRNRTIKQMTGDMIIDTGTENTLEQFISIVNRCDILVTSDSLALHVASALKKNVVVFFGPTSPQEIHLYGRGWIWQHEQPCGCYYRNECSQPAFCLDDLRVSDVIEQIQGWRRQGRSAKAG